MGVAISASQIREIKTHMEIELKAASENSASQVSVKTEPENETAPPTPKISRKVIFSISKRKKVGDL